MRLLPLLSLLLLASCRFLGGEKIHGNGHITSVEKSPGNFSSVSVSGAMNVRVRQETSNAVKIEADENLMNYIDVYVKGNTLIVKEKDGYDLDPSKELIVYASAPVFREISVSGSGEIISENTITGSEDLEISVSGSGDIRMDVKLPKVATHISGSGTVSMRGQATDFNVSMSGSGDVKCFDLVSDNVSIDISGGADAEVTANKTLDVSVSGSAEVRYKGTAQVNTPSISGSGKITKVD